MTSKVFLARILRKRMRGDEREFWECVRKKKMGFRFYRKKIVEGQIYDFWCSKLKLIVEFTPNQSRLKYVFPITKGYKIITLNQGELKNTNILERIREMSDNLIRSKNLKLAD